MARAKYIIEKDSPVGIRKKISTKGENVYQYYFYSAKVGEKKREHSKSGFKTEAEALAAGEKAYADFMGTGIHEKDSKSMISIDDFIYTEWFPQRQAAKNWQVNTIANYQKNINNSILPALTGRPIASIKSAELQKLINDEFFVKHRTPNSVCEIHCILYAIFKYAYEMEYITKSPMDHVSIPHCESDEDDDTNEQVRNIIPEEAFDKIFARFPEGSSAYLPIAIALFTGMRLGEVFGLMWEDIDFENNCIYLRRQMQQAKNLTYLSYPKYNSKRKIPLCDSLKTILLKEKAKQESENHINHYYISKRPDGAIKNTHGVFDIYVDWGTDCTEAHFVNVRSDGSIKTPDIMKHTSRVIHGFSCDHKKKEVINPLYPEFNFHSIRHTFCSLLYIAGIPANYIGAIVGHKTKDGVSKTTAKYLHIPYSVLESVVNEIEQIYTFKMIE